MYGMKKLLTIFFISTIGFCFSQTKEELIRSIISVNRVESNCVGYGCVKSKQYENFEKLKKKLSDQELVQLSNHRNSTIRIYASKALIQTIPNLTSTLLLNELENNKAVKTFDGCIIDVQKTSSIIYHEYWNKIRIEAIREINGNNYEEDLAMREKVASDFIMEKLDSIIIHSEKEVDWLLYNRAFENRKHKDNYLPRIKKLAFSKNNAYAFEYLKKHYTSQYTKELENYLKNDFPKAKFQNENEVFYLHLFIDILLESKNDSFKQIAIDKLKSEEIWKKHKGWFNATMKKNGIEL